MLFRWVSARVIHCGLCHRVDFGDFERGLGYKDFANYNPIIATLVLRSQLKS